MTDQVSPANITAAAVVMQFCLSAIIFVGALWVIRQEKKFDRFYPDRPNIGRYAAFLIAFSLISIGLLIFSDQFSGFWKPLSGEVSFSFVVWSRALLLVFCLNIICAAVLVQVTGGSYRSPFTAIYFILPALALFLRESPQRIVFYALTVSVLFVLGIIMRSQGPELDENTYMGAYGLVSVGCLMLSVVIGFITRAH